MENTALTLVPKKKKKRKKKIYIILFILLLILILGAGTAYVVVNYSLENMEVSGNVTYSDSEVLHAVEAEDFVPNTLVMVASNRIFGRYYLPFIEKITMSCKEPHTLAIKVKEKMRAGVFEYMGKYIYFNDDGMAMESRTRLFDRVPVVTGLQYDSLVLGEKIPVKGDYFQTIVMITKLISTYKLDISEIHFDGEDDITLISGDYKIYLGSSQNLEDKMSKISSVLESVSKKEKSGTIDLHLYTNEKEIITFFK